MKLPQGKFPAPKIYCVRKFSESNLLKGYIIMEYLENVKTVHIYENITLEAMREVLHALAVMEAMSLSFDSEEKNEITNKLFSELYGQMFTDSSIASGMKMLRNFGGEELSEKIDKLENVLPEIGDVVWADNLADVLGMRRVICHGDLWSGNLLWRQNGSHDLKLVAMVDYQASLLLILSLRLY
ncbi:unnamed protein product [Strongylus vulgaris]|uniref:CHK kinase-like domain-containing protein n=1 Tax=Strongylus vulgaris TaxID=40348 RepID=A0A3P7IR93_STRVU|nr:unnamed protein product [Strongylus vulgaris]